MSDKELAIITNQLQGIMDCTNMMELAYLDKNKSLYCIQKQRLNCLMRLHRRTSEKLMDQYHQMIPVVTNFTKIDNINAMVTEWITWNKTAIDLYKIETDQWYQYILSLHYKDLKLAQQYADILKPKKITLKK